MDIWGAFMCSVSTQRNLVVTFWTGMVKNTIFELWFAFFCFIFSSSCMIEKYSIHSSFSFMNILTTLGLWIICSKKYCVFLRKPLCRKVINFVSQIKSNQMQILSSILQSYPTVHCNKLARSSPLWPRLRCWSSLSSRKLIKMQIIVAWTNNTTMGFKTFRNSIRLSFP